jgi:hypothetical protein
MPWASDALLFDPFFLAKMVEGIHKKLGSDGQETDGDGDDTKAYP